MILRIPPDNEQGTDLLTTNLGNKSETVRWNLPHEANGESETLSSSGSKARNERTISGSLHPKWEPHRRRRARGRKTLKSQLPRKRDSREQERWWSTGALLYLASDGLVPGSNGMWIIPGVGRSGECFLCRGCRATHRVRNGSHPIGGCGISMIKRDWSNGAVIDPSFWTSGLETLELPGKLVTVVLHGWDSQSPETSTNYGFRWGKFRATGRWR